MTCRLSHWHADALAVLVLVALWAAFFWQFLTPIPEDQASLAEGDFSGQFVAFGAYQAARLWRGEVPLWNPYNNGGLPFLADTQSAVFYPPRLITVALAGLAGEWTYHTLELEMLAHVLLGSILMYALVRRLTAGQPGSVFGGLVGAVTWSYGGFMTGYPPLQLAVLEAAIWGPLILLGVHEATAGERIRWPWLAMSGLALGLCLMAGHPQTAWLLIGLLLALLAYRVYLRRWHWAIFVIGGALVGGLAGALAAVQLLPGLEYLPNTTRIGYTFAAKSGGFPIYDAIQFLFPRVVSVWSPLYVGIGGLILAGAALRLRVHDWAFWGGAALAGLGLSFGQNTVIYGLLYNLLPGLRLFRGQERAALIVALTLSVLAGLGAVRLTMWSQEHDPRRMLKRVLTGLLAGMGLVTAVVFVLWLGPDREVYSASLGPITFSTFLAALALVVFPWLLDRPQSAWRQTAFIALIAFDLFTVGSDSLQTDPIPPTERLARPALVDAIRADSEVPPYRVDGLRGLGGNFGSLWQVPDIRGISPLWLRGARAIIPEEAIAPRAWELFAVRYVISDWAELPVPGEIVAQEADALGPVNLHRLTDPRPFALLLDDVTRVDSDEFAWALLADPHFDPRRSVILLDRGDLALPDRLEATGTAVVSAFAPEAITIEITGSTAPAVLSIALPHYPGWQATVDGEPVPLLRAYGGLSAVLLLAGAERVELVYRPTTFTLGTAISAAAWLSLTGYGGWLLLQRRRAAQQKSLVQPLSTPPAA